MYPHTQKVTCKNVFTKLIEFSRLGGQAEARLLQVWRVRREADSRVWRVYDELAKLMCSVKYMGVLGMLVLHKVI